MHHFNTSSDAIPTVRKLHVTAVMIYPLSSPTHTPPTTTHPENTLTISPPRLPPISHYHPSSLKFHPHPTSRPTSRISFPTQRISTNLSPRLQPTIMKHIQFNPEPNAFREVEAES